jgi:hypothetical protein
LALGFSDDHREAFMRDLRADWRGWSRNERLFCVLTLNGTFLVAALPYLIAL